MRSRRASGSFLDIGSGLPTADNVHQIAKAVAPGARVVYVDYDPVVLLHSQVILGHKSEGVIVVEGDLRNPQGITDDSHGIGELVLLYVAECGDEYESA